MLISRIFFLSHVTEHSLLCITYVGISSFCQASCESCINSGESQLRRKADTLTL